MKRDYRIRTQGGEYVRYSRLVNIVRLSEGRWATFSCLSKDRGAATVYFPSGPVHESPEEARFFLGATLRGAYSEGNVTAKHRLSSQARLASKKAGDL